ncbi:MAG: histone family protein DNA-binding protein [uncultured bacterium]|nr:MAG: histone family protein DNA-binding protein [uncultured bacterium]OGT24546.1 MAG: integration host factor subunit alpha [Gammaproteobacteria bacterium RIFCSPHIGHO2_12_38_15]
MTLTKADIIAHLASSHYLEPSDTKVLVNSFFDNIKSYLMKGEKVKVSSFGNFEIREKKPRPGRNPKTGEEKLISARRVVSFHVGDKLKEKIEKLKVAS